MKLSPTFLTLVGGLTLLSAGCSKGAATIAPAPVKRQALKPSNPPGGTLKSPATYETLKPFFQAHCSGCHGEKFKAAGFDVTSYQAIVSTGEGGPVIKPGDPEGSQIITMITGTGDRASMPQRQPMLPLGDWKAIYNWIKDGAREK